MLPTKGTSKLAGAAVMVMGAAMVLPGSSRAAEPVLAMSAVAVNMSGVGRARPQTIEIVIERWSTDEERKALMDTIVEKGTDDLLEAVQKIKPRAGFIRTTTSLGWDIQFAHYEDLPSGGRKIVFGTDRPMGFYEVRDNTRSADYEYMLCEIRLGPDGKGVGKLATAAKISYDRARKELEIENYGIEPVRLTQVTATKK